MFRTKQHDVVVVGAGPVGLVTALSLARKGIRVKIIDEAWQRAAHAYGLALHPASVSILDRLGVLESVLDKCYRIRAVGVYEGAQRQVDVDISALKGDFSFIAVLRQCELEELLTHALARNGVQVEWSRRMAQIQQGPESVHLTVDHLDKESVGYAVGTTSWIVKSSAEFAVPFVVGCDGGRSLVRRQLGISFPDVGPAEHYAVFEFSTDYDFDHEMRIMLNPKNTSVVWPMPDGCCRFSFQLPEYDDPCDERVKNRLLVELGVQRYPYMNNADLERLLRERAPWFSGSIDSIRWRLLVRFERRLAQSFGSGRVWLAGDAAHLASPVGIQSMNVGLREGVQVAELLAGILQGKSTPQSMVHYGEERRREWELLLGLGSKLVPITMASAWMMKYGRTLLTGLPASGANLAALARQVGLAQCRTVA